MNIFVSDPNPIKSAEYLDDKRVIKMVLESAQLLSTAINVSGGVGPYKTTHVNHPCSVWCRETIKNYDWLLQHFSALCGEYTKRYNKRHKCTDLWNDLLLGSGLMPNGTLTPHPNCTTLKDEPDTYKAYRDYLSLKWKNDKRTPTWYRIAK